MAPTPTPPVSAPRTPRAPIGRTALRRLFLAGLVLPALAAWSAENGFPARAIPPLTTVAEVAAHWPAATTDDLPVRLEGVVTSTMPSGALRLHDGTLGIFVTRSAAGQQVSPGERVRISGVLRQGGFSPWITPHAITALGRGAFPEARPAAYSLLASGAADNQWLEVEGVVRGAELLTPPDFIVVDLGMAGGNLRVLINRGPHPKLETLVDAKVRLRGVASVNVNKHGHVVEPTFRVPSFAEVTVLRPAQPDPFATPLVPFTRLLRHPQEHRVRTSGVVTRRLSDTVFFLRDGALGLKVETRQPVAFRSGDRVDVAGFAVMSDGLAVLEQAIGRVVGTGPPPPPAEAEIGTLLDGTHNCDLVRLQARLVDWAATGRNVTLIFEAGDRLFKGLLTLPAGTPLALPEKDSVVHVTGICVISELEDTWFYQPRSFVLLVADRADLVLVRAPPWWTPERLGRALGLAVAVLLAAAAWVWALRRQIGRKRAVIEQQARHAAALEERTRIARELHDTLEQGLTGLSLQMKAIETDLNGSPHPAKARLTFARQMLRQSRALAHHAIRELRSETIPPRLEGLVAGLKRAADTWNLSGALTVNLQVTGTTRPLPSRLEHHLLGIGTEAMTNAVKHGRADAIQLGLEFGAAGIALRIADNGTGFEPAAHLQSTAGCFGLLGMRERAREIGGMLQIQSQPGRGTQIAVAVPFPAASTRHAAR